MARGKQKSLDERIAIFDSEIAEMTDRKTRIETKISELNAAKQELVEKQKLEQASNLLEIIKASGKTPEDIAKMLQNDSTESA